jgi:glycosyltransferase involved in cell wall biosynthesis
MNALCICGEPKHLHDEEGRCDATGCFKYRPVADAQRKQQESLPLVSAIMPTRNRREMTKQAIASFLSQDYEQKELLICDDEDAPSLELNEFPVSRNVIYIVTEQQMTIGAKRNELCEWAAGEIIVHFDSDDWSHPHRIGDQVSRLLASRRAVTGYHSLLFWDGREATKFVSTRNDYACGATLCFLKSFWEKHPFENLQIGEDNRFVRAAQSSDEIIATDCGAMMVARIHSGNTFTKPGYPPISLSELPKEFWAAI